ncbi:MAG: hypothetical protein KH972_01165 [Peptostreptococcaceae bacterium]|nr:hypothetical protein [Peptostreptococcaceae bacterium]
MTFFVQNIYSYLSCCTYLIQYIPQHLLIYRLHFESSFISLHKDT